MAEAGTTKNTASSTRDLTIVPNITFGFVESFINGHSKSLGNQQLSKGYKYFSEKYITDITVHSLEKSCLVKAKCHRSQRKNEPPHSIEIIIQDGPVMESGSCSCTIGKSGTCGHLTGLLYCLAHMKSSGMNAIPADVLKTSLPQTWHMPRGEKIVGSNVDDLVVSGYNLKNPYRQPRGLRSTLFNPIKDKVLDVNDLCHAISEVDSKCLLLTVISPDNPCTMVETKFGKFPKGSPLSVQQKLSTHFIQNILDADEYPSLPVKNVIKNEYQMVLDEKKYTNFKSICLSVEECIEVEKMTRLQSSDPKWHAMRKDRITASVAGEIAKRRAENEPLVARLKSTRRVLTESMRYGLSHEAVAADAFSKLQEDSINIYPCGIVVSPYAPWLAASPDRKIYNPTMDPSYGLLEIKCPTKPLAECEYLIKEGQNWVLKKNHNYYYQIMMQLAITGLDWCYFFVWREDEVVSELIHFDECFWQALKNKLDMFYFDFYLN